jgi:hypothetical protein
LEQISSFGLGLYREEVERVAPENAVRLFKLPVFDEIE